MFSALKRRVIWIRHSSLIRLTLVISAIFAFAFFVVSLVTFYLVDRQTLTRVDTELRGLLAQDIDNDDLVLHPDVIAFRADDLDDFPRPFDRIERDSPGVFSLDGFNYRGKNDWRVLLDRKGTEWVLVAKSLNDQEDILDAIASIYVSVATVVLVLVVSIGFGVAIYAQRRFDQITRVLSALAQGDLRARVQPRRLRDDIDQLALSLDRTAEQLESLVTQTRNLGANIAHDLRTPFARLAMNLNRAKQGDPKGIDRALDDVDRLSATFDAIMRIARIEAESSDTKLWPLNLCDLAHEVVDLFGPVLEDAGKNLDIMVNAPAQVVADQELLIQALGNLIQNARVYGGQQITVFVQSTRIGVRDDGIGVPNEMLTKITQPMVRLDRTRQSDGAGLGLAMVKAVADRHNANLEVCNQPASGLQVSFNFANL